MIRIRELLRVILASALVGIGVGPLAAQPSSHPSAGDENERIVLRHARVLDSRGTIFQTNVSVTIHGDRIHAVRENNTDGDVDPQNPRILDLDGLYLIPGLIDLHTHFVLYPYDQATWNDQVLKESLELRTIRGVTAARNTLYAGFTTVRELGTEGAGFADVALKRAVELGLIQGPTIYASTRAIVATGCYGPSGFDPRWQVPKGAQVADGVDGVRKAVREQIAAGADWIKVYADYRRKRGDRSTPTFSQAELDAIVDEATSAGIPVAAHASTNEAIRRAVLAGVRTIEHGYEATPETLSLMKSHGVSLCPTLAASEAVSRYSGWRPGTDPEPPRVLTARKLMRKAIESGVEIACGSDAGVFAHGENAREIELMVEYGLSPRDALRAATSTAARVLGRGDHLGRIAEGYFADLVAVKDNPLKDPSHLREVVLVIKNGDVVLDLR